MKIKCYDDEGGWLNNYCKVKKSIIIGSVGCSKCEYYKRLNYKKNVVICKYKETKWKR